MYIYVVTNLINGKQYVGKTCKTVEEQWKNHLEKARAGKRNHLYRAIRKYGSNVFVAEGLTTCSTIEQLNELEKMWIILLRTYSLDSGYNMTFGGDGCSGTPEVRGRISESRKSQTTSQHQKIMASQTHKGKAKSLIQRQRIAASWTPSRRTEQAQIAAKVNRIENKKLKDYTCPTCKQVFNQVTKGAYGGHRKACLFWKDVQ